MNKVSQVRKVRARKGVMATLVCSLFVSMIVVGTPTASWGSDVAEPSIAFLNPSGFSSAGERGITISDTAPDSGPGCCDAATPSYRLAAWVANPPPSYSVFFSFEQNSLDLEITNTEQTQEGEWQTQWTMPATVLDGPATLHAYIVVNEEAVASVDQDVTITREADSTHITYPQNDGMFGTFAPLATALPDKGAAERKKPIGVVDTLYSGSASSSYVRSFYTTSPPGTEPKWKVCGTESVGSTGDAADSGIRCVLDPADQTAVTAVASVVNDSPNDYDDRFNQSGDAVAVSDPYAQQPTTLTLDPATQFQHVNVEPKSGIFYCSAASIVSLTDQVGHKIAGANIDVHATGPSDTLHFDTFSVLTKNQPPDRGDHTEKTAYDCTGQNATASTPPGDANPDVEGVHRRFGAPDRKHIEVSSRGTNDFGQFSFRFHSDDIGQTDYTAWVDEQDDGCLTNDDLFLPGEVYATGAIGWGEDPLSPVDQPYETPVPCSPDGSTPSPTITPPARSARSISLSVSDRPGAAVTLRGQITSDETNCTATQGVRLKMKRNGRFHTFATVTTTRRGTYKFVKRTSRSHTYRAVAPQTSACLRAHSPTVRE